MQIQKYLFQSGNDFSALLMCEHCQGTQRLSTGYHDAFYHNRVLPSINCHTCGKDRAGNIAVNAEGTQPVLVEKAVHE